MMRFIQQRLELKIAAALIAVLGCIVGIFTLIDIRIMRDDTVQASQRSLRALAAAITGGLNSAMSRGHADDVQRMLDSVRVPSVVERIMIFDERGALIRRSSGAQDSATVPPDLLAVLHGTEMTRLDEVNGVRYLSYYTPIINRPECFRCHGSGPAVNGILRLDFSLAAVDAQLAERRNRIIVWSLVMIGALMAGLTVLLRLLVHRPLLTLRGAMARTEAGERVEALSVPGSDELADLTAGFTRMLQTIHGLHASNVAKEKELARTQEMIRFKAELQAMFDAMPDAVLLIDPELRIIQSNPRVDELLPRLKEFGGVIPLDRSREESCPHYQVRAVFERNEIRGHFCTIKLQDGGERHVHSVCAPVRENGRVAFAVEVIRDITERVRTERELEEKTAELLSANRLLVQLAVTDSLTQVHNRRHFDEILYKEVKRLNRRKYASLSLLLIDIDYFKKLNDTHGHITGDAVLREVATAIKEEVRETDTVARYGGEEFVVIMPDTRIDGAVHKAELIRRKIRTREFLGQRGAVRITVSIGAAECAGGSPHELLQAADEALYAAKNAGRDMTMVRRGSGPAQQVEDGEPRGKRQGADL